MINLDRVGWENGTLISKAKVEINGTIYEVEPEEYSGTTPLSAENLKEMENNTENAINELNSRMEGTVLFENANGTTDDITLTNDMFTNYSRIKIFGYFYINTIRSNVHTEIVPNTNNFVSLGGTLVGGGTLYFLFQDYTLTSTSLTKYRRGYKNLEGGLYAVNPANELIYITKIIGYNY